MKDRKAKVYNAGLLVCLILLSACSQSPMPLSDIDEREVTEDINQSFDGLVAAAKSLDVDQYLAYFDRVKFTSLNEDGTVLHSLEDFEQMYRQQIPHLKAYQSLEFDRVKITVIDRTTAILVNEFKATVELASGDTLSMAGAGTQVWANRNGAWKLVSVSSSAQP